MLKLIIDNTKQRGHCRDDCDLYDDLTDLCSVIMNADISNPATVYDCRFFLSKRLVETPTKGTAIEEPFHERIVSAVDKRLYPLLPDEPAYRDDAVWFLSPCMKYGCWIVNTSKKRLYAVSTSSYTMFPEEVRIYRSPYPLHNHNAPMTLASKVAWYVNEEGYGAYMLLNKGKLIPVHNNQ